MMREILVFVCCLAGYRHKGLLVDGTFMDPQAVVRLQAASATMDGSAVTTPDCAWAHGLRYSRTYVTRRA